jgi:hypothetical protein
MTKVGGRKAFRLLTPPTTNTTEAVDDKSFQDLCDTLHSRIPVNTLELWNFGTVARAIMGIKAYLKWHDDVIGEIADDDSVRFLEPGYNTVVRFYTHGSDFWSTDVFADFLAERTVSRERRDIEHILFRLGLSAYDLMAIAYATRAMHPKDLLWIATTPKQRYEDAMTEVFDCVFVRHIDLLGDSVDSPEGYNVKRYGVYQGRYGIYKQRINPLTTDVESEVAVYLLAQKMGVCCCPAYQTDADTVFSEFCYNFSREYIVHARHLFLGRRSDDEYRNLLSVRPSFAREIQQMILLDFVTRQDDRHLSNIAFKVADDQESFYPLYDNGRSLFYEDTPELVEKAVADPILYATTFGPSGTYYEHVQTIAAEAAIAKLVNLDIPVDEIEALLRQANFRGYRLDGATAWITRTLDLLKQLAR